MSRRDAVHRRSDSASVWGLRILAAVGVIATCGLALTRSPRVGWMALATLMVLLLCGVNKLRVRAKFKYVRGAAARPRRARGKARG